MTEQSLNNWFVFYTKSRTEKKINKKLNSLGYETFLPLQTRVSQWKDRKKHIDFPLFPSYIFVNTQEKIIPEILKMDGIVYVIKINNKPVIVNQKEIELITKLIESKLEIEVQDNKIMIVTKIKFSSGVFKGYEGTVIKEENSKKVIIKIESLEKNLLIKFDTRKLKTIQN